MSAALAFHTLFGLAPVLVVGMILVKSIRGSEATLMWACVLFGLQVSVTLQMLHGRSLDEVDHRKARTGMIDRLAC